MAYTPNAELSVADRARRQAAQAQAGRFLRRFAVIHTGEESRTVDLSEKVFVDLAKRYRSRPGGYTRIIKVGRRRGDNAPMVIVQLVEEGEGKAEAGKPVEAEKPVEPAAQPAESEKAEPKAEEPKAEAASAAEAAPAEEPAEEEKKPSRAKKEKDEAGE